MRIAVWKTGHEIADTVAEALAEGFNANIYNTSGIQDHGSSKCTKSECVLCSTDVHIGYGILRGTSDVFRISQAVKGHWLQCDRGYFAPGHYDGYYRISYKGTQAKWHEGILKEPGNFDLQPWRGFDPSKPILVCPPTDAVCSFFGFKWWDLEKTEQKFVVRHKGDTSPVNFLDYNYVLTFNSSMGWKALQAGIPSLSDPKHSIVGSYYQSLTQNSQDMRDSRMKLFEAMNAHQFTLQEIKQGKAWSLINHYISLSDMTHEKPLQPMSVNTPSENGLKHLFQSSI